MSPINYKEQRLTQNEARKLIAKIVHASDDKIRFSNHSIIELRNDGLTSVDALNVLKSTDSKIYQEGEWINGSYRYRLETKNLVIVIGFWDDGSGINIITAWDKRKGK